MRVSVVGSDPGYKRDACWHDVTLNGDHVLDAVTADEEGGYVVRLAKGENGRYLVEGDQAVLETVKGEVRVYPPAYVEKNGVKEPHSTLKSDSI